MADTIETLPQLFDTVKATFPTTLGPDKWYLVAVSRQALNTEISPSASRRRHR